MTINPLLLLTHYYYIPVIKIKCSTVNPSARKCRNGLAWTEPEIPNCSFRYYFVASYINLGILKFA